MKIREFPVMMNYRATVEELIESGNLKIGWGGNMLDSQNFPPIMPKSKDSRYLQEKSIYVINFGEATSTDKVKEDLKRVQPIRGMNLKPADIFEVLTLNRTYPASPGIKQEYSLAGLSIVALNILLAKMGETGVYLAPVLICDDEFKNPFEKSRIISLNSTEFFDVHTREVKKIKDWWPGRCSFAAVSV